MRSTCFGGSSPSVDCRRCCGTGVEPFKKCSQGHEYVGRRCLTCKAAYARSRYVPGNYSEVMRLRRAGIAEDYLFILEHEGGTRKTIGARLGVSQPTLRKALREAGGQDSLAC